MDECQLDASACEHLVFLHGHVTGSVVLCTSRHPVCFLLWIKWCHQSLCRRSVLAWLLDMITKAIQRLSWVYLGSLFWNLLRLWSIEWFWNIKKSFKSLPFSDALVVIGPADFLQRKAADDLLFILSCNYLLVPISCPLQFDSDHILAFLGLFVHVLSFIAFFVSFLIVCCGLCSVMSTMYKK